MTPAGPVLPRRVNHCVEDALAVFGPDPLKVYFRLCPHCSFIPFTNCGDGRRTYIGEVWSATMGVRVVDNAYIIVVVAWIQLITGSPCEVLRIGPLTFP